MNTYTGSDRHRAACAKGGVRGGRTKHHKAVARWVGRVMPVLRNLGLTDQELSQRTAQALAATAHRWYRRGQTQVAVAKLRAKRAARLSETQAA